MLAAKYCRFAQIILAAMLLAFCQKSIPAESKSEHEWMIAKGDSLRGAGDYDLALESYFTAVPLFRSEGNFKGEADALRGIGSVYYYQGDFDGAMEYWEKARQIYHNIRDKKGEGKILSNFGQVNSDLSNFDQAIEYLNQSLTIARELKDAREEGIASQNLGNVYLKRSEYPKALQHYKECLRIFRETRIRRYEMITLSTIGSVYFYLYDYAKALDYYKNSYQIAQELRDRRHEASTLNNLGIAHNRLDQYDQALSYYEQSLALCRELDNQNAEGNVLNNLGLLYSAREHYQSAMKYFTMSLEVFRNSRNQIGICSNLINIGKIYSKQGKHKEAQDSLRVALETARKVKTDNLIQAAYQAMGDCYLENGETEEAQSAYSHAIATAESIRGKLNMEAQKTSYASGVFGIYENMVTLLFMDHQFAEAFNYVERARARSFLDILGGDIQVGKSMDSEFLPTSSNGKANEPVLRSANSRQALTLPEVQQLLDSGTTLLEYFITEHNLLEWVITAEHFDAMEVDITADSLRSLVGGFRETIQWRGSTDYLSTALHRVLIDPVLPEIKTEKLVIIPHGILHYLPFQALRDQDGTYLFEKYQISCLPSASVMKYLPEKRHDKINNILAFGNPACDPGKRNPITFSKSEVECIGKVFRNCEIYQDSLASESMLRKRVKECDILHLACHAELSSSYPMYSGLMMATDSSNDGELDVHEIFSLNMHARLVVLSACQTGLGQLTTGDELVGLSRAFLCAGARSLVSSLWSVNDESTGYFMECFYRNLNTHNKAESLQIAEHDTKEKYHDIYDWAPFVLIGAAD